jgi:hypothetical protein
MEGALDKNDFMEVFYKDFIEKLIAPVGGSDSAAAADNANNSISKAAAKPAAAPAAAGKAAGSGGKAEVPASTIGLIVDLLCFCVQHHAFWAKYHVLR